MFNENNLPHELLLTTRKTTKFRNAIENNMPTSIKLSKTQISKRIQSGGFLGSLLRVRSCFWKSFILFVFFMRISFSILSLAEEQSQEVCYEINIHCEIYQIVFDCERTWKLLVQRSKM